MSCITRRTGSPENTRIACANSQVLQIQPFEGTWLHIHTIDPFSVSVLGAAVQMARSQTGSQYTEN